MLMMYKEVEDPRLRTTYAATVRVRVIGDVDSDINLQLEFPSAPSAEGEQCQFSQVIFKTVFEYRWVHFDHAYPITNEEDSSFSLIEIIDSEHIKMMLERGMFRDQPIGKRFGGTVDE